MSYFYDRFGCMPRFEATAPGRVTLLGEHADYDGGHVLPLALPQVTTVELSPTGDSQVVATSLQGANHADTCRYTLGAERPFRDWGDYVRGVTHLLRGSGRRIGGFNALIRSTVPQELGLSASAALAISLLRALRQAFQLDLDDVTIAGLAHQVEKTFIGADGDVTAPMAVSIGRTDAALYLDASSMTWRHVAMPDQAEVIVIHAGVVHRDAATLSDVRRQECEKAAIALDVGLLHELGPDDLTLLDSLPATLAKRVRHVITENARVLAAVAALERDDLPALGRLFHESQRSMRDDYQITVPEVDLLVDLLRFEPSVYGARMTGGGFGGSVVALVEAGRGGIVAKKIARRYGEQSGRQPAILLPQ